METLVAEPRPPLDRRGSDDHSHILIPSRRNPICLFVSSRGFLLALAVPILAAAVLLSAPPADQEIFSPWPLSLPPPLREHFSRGRLLKLRRDPLSPTEVFVIDVGGQDPAGGPVVLLLHGLACSSFSFRRVLPDLAARGLRVVAIDLPGSGFSDAPAPARPSSWLIEIVEEIYQKGIFFAFEQLVETGQMRYQQVRSVPRCPPHPMAPYGAAAFADLIREVIEIMALGPVHLVLHDSSFSAGASFVSSNSGLVSSMVILDAAAAGPPAFPMGLLGVPVLGKVLLRMPAAFAGILRLCCSRSMMEEVAEGYRRLLGRVGRVSAAIETGKELNYSFDLGAWRNLPQVRELPILVLWSGSWSDQWIDEGRRFAVVVPKVQFEYHSGGRWPQEDAPEEISERITRFVTSLTATAYVAPEGEETIQMAE